MKIYEPHLREMAKNVRNKPLVIVIKRRFLIIKTEHSSINTLHFYEKPKKGALQTMSLRAFNYGANAVCFEKTGVNTV